MASQPERSDEAGNRDRDQRRAARSLLQRIERWEVPDDSYAGRPHRRSRARVTRRRLR